jgi:L-alanine-DL-glutamate epimerase-like enolase superfamily enzyme
MEWSIEKIELVLKFEWKISRNSSTHKTNFIVSVLDKGITGRGEVAPNTRYNETPERIEQEFSRFLDLVKDLSLSDLEKIRLLIAEEHFAHSLQFAINSALLHLHCQNLKIEPFSFFNLKKVNSVYTDFSMPILDPSEIKDFIKPLSRFKSLKLKINKEIGLDIIKEVAKYSTQVLRIDANEAYENVEELISFTEKISKNKIEFMEQPMPARLKDEYRYYKKYCKFDIVADESIEDNLYFDDIATQFTAINIKLMKSASYQNAFAQIEEAKKHKLKIMIGCMVETSLGIYSAMQLASEAHFLDLDGFLIVKDEPFNLIKEENGELFFT